MSSLLAVMLALAAPPREVGNLVYDAVPEIPATIAERTAQYQNTRGALLLDWAPDGQGVLVATRFADTPQVHLVSSPGAYREQLTFFAEPVTEAVFDPTKGKTGFMLRMDTGGSEAYQYYWLDRTTGRKTLITDGKARNEGLVSAHKSGAFAWSSTQRNGRDFDIWVRDAGGTRLLYEAAGKWSALAWSLDDKQLLIQHYVSINESTLWVLDVASGKTTAVNPSPQAIAYRAGAFASDGSVFYTSDEASEFTRLVRYEFGSAKKQVLTSALPWDVESVTVSANGKYLAYLANVGGTSAIYLAETKTPEKARQLKLPVGVAAGLAFDPAGTRLGFTMSTAQSTADVYSADVRSLALTRWTFSEVGGLDPASFVAPELVEVTSFDGKKIPAWYYRAHGRTPAPVIVSIHGGPESQATAAFRAEIQYWVNELGVAVLVPNVRGSSGYGKTYLLLDNGDKREDSVRDIGALLDWVGTRQELDPKRVAVHGGSYGGYMVLAALATYGARLKCGIDVVGISNFVTFLNNTESYRRDLRRAEYGDERDATLRAFLERISPTTNAGKITQPLFVVQGKNDPRVPATEAEQIVRTVRKNGGAVWYLLAKDEGHGFQKKVNKDAYQNAAAYFFEQYLLK